MSASGNLGVRHAKRAYVASLDSDDVRLPHTQMTIIDSEGRVAMVCRLLEYWYSWTRTPDDAVRGPREHVRIVSGLAPPPGTSKESAPLIDSRVPAWP